MKNIHVWSETQTFSSFCLSKRMEELFVIKCLNEKFNFMKVLTQGFLKKSSAFKNSTKFIIRQKCYHTSLLIASEIECPRTQNSPDHISRLALRCSVLLAPANGRLENTACGKVYGSVCRLVCYKGYDLKGSVERKCEKIAGTDMVQWTGNATSCEGKLSWYVLWLVTQNHSV